MPASRGRKQQHKRQTTQHPAPTHAFTETTQHPAPTRTTPTYLHVVLLVAIRGAYQHKRQTTQHPAPTHSTNAPARRAAGSRRTSTSQTTGSRPPCPLTPAPRAAAAQRGAAAARGCSPPLPPPPLLPPPPPPPLMLLLLPLRRCHQQWETGKSVRTIHTKPTKAYRHTHPTNLSAFPLPPPSSADPESWRGGRSLWWWSLYRQAYSARRNSGVM